MMMMKRWKIGILVPALLLSQACTEYLDLKPYGETIPETPEEFEALLHYRLDRVDQGTESAIMKNRKSVLNFECFADNLDALLTKYPEGNSLPLYIGSRLNAMQVDYQALYAVIRDCNLVIEHMVQRETAKGKQVLATAYALRGVCYYNLLQQFCEPYQADGMDYQQGLCIVDKFDMEEKTLRSSMEATVRFIENDFKTSIAFNQTNPVYGFTADVAKASLVRFYFWIEAYEKLLPLGEELLERYPLIGGEAYKEMIRSKSAATGNILIRSGVYTTENEITAVQSLVKYRPVSRSFTDLFEEKARDVRYALSFNDKREVIKPVNAQLRSAEIALMLAEAYAHLSNTEHALKHLNALREKRIEGHVDYTLETLPPVPSAGLIRQDATGKPLTPLLAAILKERQKEFLMEGDRWFELKRNGRPEFWVARDGLKYTIQAFMYTAPINKKDVDLTPGLEQNEGYEL